jgi:hypothetical protein
MSNKSDYELPSKGTWRAMKAVKNSELRNLKVTTGEKTTIIDAPVSINFRWIPKVFTAPFQAIGLVASIFARMTHTKITLQMKDHEK